MLAIACPMLHFLIFLSRTFYYIDLVLPTRSEVAVREGNIDDPEVYHLKDLSQRLQPSSSSVQLNSGHYKLHISHPCGAVYFYSFPDSIAANSAREVDVESTRLRPTDVSLHTIITSYTDSTTTEKFEVPVNSFSETDVLFLLMERKQEGIQEGNQKGKQETIEAMKGEIPDLLFSKLKSEIPPVPNPCVQPAKFALRGNEVMRNRLF